MTAGPHTQRQWPWPDLARWLACFTLALFVHVGGALTYWHTGVRRLI